MEYRNKKTNNDRWIVEHIFPGEHGKYFVEAGACNGIQASSCYVLEKYLGWTGICVEPNNNYFQQLVVNRPKSICENLCLSNKSGTVTYIQGDNDNIHPMLGGIKSNLIKYRHDYQETVTLGQQVTRKSITLHELLKKHNAPQIIHYLAMDIEGSELPVLEIFPFEEYRILALSIEGSRCNNLLAEKGYINIKNPYNISAAHEQYFIHKSIATKQNISMNINVTELINTAKNYQAEQKPLKAIATYKQALKYEPNNALVLALLAIVQKEQGNLSDAISNFQKAIAIMPNSNPWIYSSLGSALQAQEKYVEATQAYYEAIILDSEAKVPVWVWQSLGHVLMQQERWNEAIEIYTKAIKTHPDNTYFKNNLKRSQLESQKKIQQANEKKNVYYDLGKKLAQEGKWQEAVASFRQGIELEPGNFESYQELAKALIQQGNIDDGITVLQRSYKLAPDSASKSQNSIYQQSIASWEKAVKNTPQNLFNLELRRGNVLGCLGLNQEAAFCHKNAIILSKNQWKSFPERNYEFTYNFFAHNIPVWVKYLARFADQPEINALEIGSWQGMSSCWLLDNILTHSSSTLTCIDLGVRPQFKHNITATGAGQKVTLITKKSEVGLRNLPVGQYDFIYIDGGHLSFEVIQDALLAWDLIKEGGVIIFDDYDWKPPENPEYGPKLAIDLFTDLFKNEIEILHHEWQVIVKKTSQRISFAHDSQK